MKNPALFSAKDKSKKLKCGLLQFLFAALRVNQSTVVMGNVSMSPIIVRDLFERHYLM